jgi:outer membrane protein assembly factor BamB
MELLRTRWFIHNGEIMKAHKILVFSIALSALAISCHTDSPNESQPPQPQPDTNWVTQPQIDIPWPGLANSAWPMFMHDPQHTGRSPYRGPQLGQMEWRFNAGYLVYSSPAIGLDGNIYFACLQNAFFAVAPSGSEVWRRAGGWGDCSPLVGSDGTIYVYGIEIASLGPMHLYAYNPSGDLKWSVPIQAIRYGGTASPVISKDGGTIYIAMDTLYAVRKDGSFAWKFLPDSSAWLWQEPAFSPDGSTLYVSGRSGLYAIDTSGSLKWKFPIVPLSYNHVLSTPSIDNAGNLYFACQNIMYSLNPDGTVRWTFSISPNGPFTPPVIGRDGTIYFVGECLYAFDYVGKLRWKYTLAGPGSMSMPAIDIQGTIYFGRATNRLPADSMNFLALNPNGTVKFQVSLRNPDGTVPDIDSRCAISSDGRIYVGSDYPYGLYLFKIK